jgi:hypothetical protein
MRGNRVEVAVDDHSGMGLSQSLQGAQAAVKICGPDTWYHCALFVSLPLGKFLVADATPCGVKEYGQSAARRWACWTPVFG